LIERVRRAGSPSVSTVCDDWLLYAPKVDAWTRAFASRPRLASLAERAGMITGVELGSGTYLFLSDTLRQRAAAVLPAVAGSEVVHRGPDVELFSRAPAREWEGKLLYAGRIDPRKGIELAITALQRLPESATLTVDGAGDEGHLAQLKRLVAKEGLESRVRFRRTPRRDLAAAYAGVDAVVFPVTWAEPWGLVPLEAMVVGRPVVATGMGGSGEYLRHGENCLLFDPSRGAEELAERVRELEADSALRERLCEGGFRTAESLSAERFNERVLAAIERAGVSGPE
jgi:glycosyltransferase involved in cell wall biosynthesis